jgi:hypothetical protein
MVSASPWYHSSAARLLAPSPGDSSTTLARASILWYSWVPLDQLVMGVAPCAQGTSPTAACGGRQRERRTACAKGIPGLTPRTLCRSMPACSGPHASSQRRSGERRRMHGEGAHGGGTTPSHVSVVVPPRPPMLDCLARRNTTTCPAAPAAPAPVSRRRLGGRPLVDSEAPTSGAHRTGAASGGRLEKDGRFGGG